MSRPLFTFAGQRQDTLDTCSSYQRQLRSVTHRDNLKNSKLFASNTSGHPGVRFHRRQRRWVAYITSEQRHINLGSFAELGEALAARQAAERCLGFHPNHGRR